MRLSHVLYREVFLAATLRCSQGSQAVCEPFLGGTVTNVRLAA